MKILCYSDTHIRDTGSFEPWNAIGPNGISYELENIITGYRFIADMVLEHKPDLVVCLGDVVQHTEFQTVQTLFGISKCYKLLESAINSVGAQHLAILGNHDIHNEKKKIHNLHILSGYGVNVIDDFFIGEFCGSLIALIPYTSNLAEVYSSLSVAQQSAKLILTHLDFQGARYDSGQISQSQISPHLTVPCISGDIHLQQSVSSVTYVGSLIQNRFNRPNLDGVGGVLIYDMDNKITTAIRNNYSKHYIRVRDGEWDSVPESKSCILKVISSKPRHEIDDRFSGYEYFVVPDVKIKEESIATYSEFVRIDPKRALRHHIESNNPEAIVTFDKYSEKIPV